MEVIGIPLPKPGFYIVELASPRLGSALHGEDKPYYVATSVLVTNLAVHLKHGRESSLVWVTTLDRGKPVAGAQVTVRDCSGKLWFEGKTDADGVVRTEDKLPPPARDPRMQGRLSPRPHRLRALSATTFPSPTRTGTTAYGRGISTCARSPPARSRSRYTPSSTARSFAPARRSA